MPRFRLMLLLLLALLLALAAFPLGGCTPKEPLDLRIPWQNRELSVLDIKQNGELVLVNELLVEQAGDDLLCTVEHLLVDYPAVQKFYLDPVTLVPRRTEYEATTPAGVRHLRATYGEKEVEIEKETDEGTVRDTVRLPAKPYFDNDQFLFLVRALPLEEAWRGSVNLVVTSTARKVAVGLEVKDRETVTVPAGTFDTYVVELKHINQFAWVAVEPPHQLVKFENRNAGTVAELVEFYPTGRGIKTEDNPEE